MTPEQHLARNEALTAFLTQARWFGGKGRDFEVSDVTTLDLAPGVSTTLVGLRYADGTDLYQVPLVSYLEPESRLDHALVGSWDGRFHYDAVHDREAMHVWLRAFAGEPSPAQDARVAFRRTHDHEPDLSSHSTLFSGEQSNSSVAFGEDCLLKLFRRVTPGINPDIEIHEVLTRAGNTHVATLYGYVEARSSPQAPPLQLAMLQQFLRTASDGWGLALASARNLLAGTAPGPDEDQDHSDSDFAAEAFRLGGTIAEVHAVLADAFGTGTADTADLAAVMTRRLDAAVAVVPEIAPYAVALTERFGTLVGLGSALTQRVHGDLHLGQTLRTSLGWKLVDFEGEPAKELTERRLPDSPWRDVAGMVRSFHYAGAALSRDLEASEHPVDLVEARARDWIRGSVNALLAGYTAGRGTPITATEQLQLDAYIADKALYEAVYEARNRPDWLPIPLRALAQLAGDEVAR